MSAATHRWPHLGDDVEIPAGVQLNIDVRERL
jgi:hypothetical protein